MFGHPVRVGRATTRPGRKALYGAADSVKAKGRASSLGVLWLIGFGVLWCVQPAAPDWWPMRERWWLIGGWATGVTMIFSGILAAAMIVYSYRHFREIKDDQQAEHALD